MPKKIAKNTQHALCNHVEYGLTAKIRMSMGARERGYVEHILNAIHWWQIPIAAM